MRVDEKPRELLEVREARTFADEIANLAGGRQGTQPGTKIKARATAARENSPDFVDDPDVPPLM